MGGVRMFAINSAMLLFLAVVLWIIGAPFLLALCPLICIIIDYTDKKGR